MRDNRAFRIVILALLVVSALPFPALKATTLVQSSSAIFRTQRIPGLTWLLDNGTVQAEGWQSTSFLFTLEGAVEISDEEGNRLVLPQPVLPRGITDVELYENETHVAVRYVRKEGGLLRRQTFDLWFYYDFSLVDEHGFPSMVKQFIHVKQWSSGSTLTLRVANPQKRATSWANSSFHVCREPEYLGEDPPVALGYDWSDVPTKFRPTALSRDMAIELEVQEGDVIDPTTVGTTTSSLALDRTFQRKSFAADGRIWVWYSNGAQGGYRSSGNNGSSWSGFTMLWDESTGRDFAVTTNGTFVFWVQKTSGSELTYRMGELNSGGAGLILLQPEDTARADTGDAVAYAPTIDLDDAGLPWYGCRIDWGGGVYRAEVGKSSTTASWTDAAGFPYNLTASSSTYAVPVGLDDGNVYVVWSDTYAGGVDARLRGKLYTTIGSSWGSEEEVTPAGEGLYDRTAFSVVLNGSHVFAAWQRNDTSRDLRFRERSSGTWQASITVEAASTTTTRPILSRDGGNEVIYYFWMGYPLAGHIYYDVYNQTSDTFAGEVDWITEDQSLTHNYALSSFEDEGGNVLGLFRLSKTSTPYNVRYDYLTVTPAPPSPSGNFSYVREVLVTGSSSGDVTDYPLRFRVEYDLNITELGDGLTRISTDVIPNTLPQESSHQGMGFVVEVGSTWYMIYSGKNATQRWTPILCNSTDDRISWTKEGIQLDLISPLKEASFISTSLLEGSTYYIYGQIMDNDADMDTGSDYAIGYWTTTDFRSFSWGGVAANGTSLGYAKPLTNPTVNKVGSTFYMAVAERKGASQYKIRMLSCPNATGPFTNVGVILDAGAASWGTSGFWDPEIFVWKGLYILHVGGAVGGTHENYGFAYSHDITKNFTPTDEYYTHSNLIGGRASVVVEDDNSKVSIYTDATIAGQQQIMNFTLDDLIDLNGRSQADCDDIEFKNSNGTTLSHFKSEITANTSYYVWVKFPFLAQSTTYTNYLYYGDATVEDSSSGLDVFVTLFDHFDDDSLNGTLWQTTGTTSESGTSIIATGQVNPSAIHTQSAIDFEGKKLIIKARTPDIQDRSDIGLTYTVDYSDAEKGWRIFWVNDAQSATHVQKEEQFDGGSRVNTILQDAIYHHFEIYRKTVGTEWVVDATSYATSVNDPNVNEYVTATRTFGASAAGNKAETDWVGVGWYIDPEPTSTISGEDSIEPEEEGFVNTDPTVGNITTTDESVNPDESFTLGCDAQDLDGADSLDHVDLAVGDESYSVELRWNVGTSTSSIYSDPSGVCTLDDGGADSINSTAIRPWWTVSFLEAYGNGTKDVTTTAVDNETAQDDAVETELFIFWVQDPTIDLSSQWRSTSIAGDPATFNITVESTVVPLYEAILSTNFTGSWVNETAISLSGFSETVSDLVTLPAVAGTMASYRWYARTTDNTWDKTSKYTFQVQQAGEVVDVGITQYSNPVAFTFQRKGFKNQLFWLIYSDGSNLVYRTSEDATSWSSATSIGAGTAGYLYSVRYDRSTGRVHIARCNSSAGGSLKYRRGIPQADGTIDWSAGWQMVYDANSSQRLYTPTIDVDSAGRVWIGFTLEQPDEESGLWVTRTNSTDGLWVTDNPNFPYQLTPYESDTDVGRAIPVALTSEKVYLLYGAPGRGWNGTLWDDGWESEENIVASSETAKSGTSGQSAGPLGDIVYFGWTDTNGTLVLWKRDAGTWTSRKVATDATEGNPSYVISLVGDNLVGGFWKDGNHIWYRVFEQDTDAFQQAAIDLVNEETDQLTAAADIASYYQDSDFLVGVTYIVKPTAPYTLRFAYISLYETDVGNVTFTGDVDGKYVFVGRTRYEYELEYQVFNTSYYEIGLGFYDDSGDWYSIEYFSEDGTTTLTSPDDGFSAMVTNVTVGVNNMVYATYDLIFQEPVADSIDVDLYARAKDPMGDTGWEVAEADLFHIYNLGGATELNATGWAGRIDGGDAFELYAADSRTAIMFDDSFERTIEYVQTGWDTWDIILPDNPWAVREFPPYSTVNHTDRYENSASRPYAFTGNKESHTWSDGKQSLRMYSVNTQWSTPYAVRRFRRKITDEVVYCTIFFQSPTNRTTVRIKFSDLPTYMSAANTAINLVIASTYDLGNRGEFFVDSSGLYEIWNAAETEQMFWDTDNWYNLTMAMNMTSQQCDLLIDGVATNVTDFGFADPVVNMEYMTLLGANGIGGPEVVNVYLDAIKVWTDWDANYGGDARVGALYHQLQHWAMDWDWDVEDPYVEDEYANLGMIELGWDVCIDGTWVRRALWVQMNISSAELPAKADNFWGKLNELQTGEANWVNVSVSWYERGDNLVKSDNLFVLFEGHGTPTTTPGAKDVMGWHWDIWFNRMDASTWMGGRINAEWFGMDNNAPGWQIWTSDWKPMISEVTESTCFVRLKDGSGTVHQVKDVSMVRPWARVWRNNESTFHYIIKNLERQNFQETDEMQGIDTPAIIKTAVPTTGGWFLGSMIGAVLSRIMSNLATTLTYGGLALWGYFASFLDVLFSWAGIQGGVSTIFGWIQDLWNNASTGLGWFVTMMSINFTFMGSFMGRMLGTMTTCVNVWVTMLDHVYDFLDTGFGSGINVWNDLNLSQWLVVGAILYPWYLLEKWDREGGDAAINHVRFMLDLFLFVFTITLSLAQFVIGLIFDLIDSIPIIE